MSLSGYDGESVGFDSVSEVKRSSSSTETMTEGGASVSATSQSTQNLESGSQCELPVKKAEYDEQALASFLRRVLPNVMEAINSNDNEYLLASSDSDDEETIVAKLFQEIRVNEAKNALGDISSRSALSVSWSSAGNSLAVSLGSRNHSEWCDHPGLIRIYTLKRSEVDTFVHSYDIIDKSCVTCILYHPSLAALLAYGTAAGDVTIYNLRNATTGSLGDVHYLTSSERHGSMRVNHLSWMDQYQTGVLLSLKHNKGGKRRGATDQCLVSAGSDGSINVWQCNINLNVFINVLTYRPSALPNNTTPDITCFDFIKQYPVEENAKVPDDSFVVGTKSGHLLHCRAKNLKDNDDGTFDPFHQMLTAHLSCILQVTFSNQAPGVFISLSSNSELRIYNLEKAFDFQVIHLEGIVTCMSWLPVNQCLALLGLGKAEDNQILRLFHLSRNGKVNVNGLDVDVEGEKDEYATAIAVNNSSQSRIAVGDSTGRVYIWDIPFRQLLVSKEDRNFLHDSDE